MNIYLYIDLFLYIAMIFDLGWKVFKINKIKKKMKKWQRYYPTSKIKEFIFIVCVMINIVYILYRCYQLVVLNDLNFIKIAVILPLLLYYVLLDKFTGGIFFNHQSMYYKQNMIYFGQIVRNFRYLENDYYHYVITFKEKDSGQRDIEMKVKNEPAAFALLAAIPFQEL